VYVGVCELVSVCFQDPRSKIQVLRSKFQIQVSRSKFQYLSPKPKIQFPSSKIQEPSSKIPIPSSLTLFLKTKDEGGRPLDLFPRCMSYCEHRNVTHL